MEFYLTWMNQSSSATAEEKNTKSKINEKLLFFLSPPLLIERSLSELRVKGL